MMRFRDPEILRKVFTTHWDLWFLVMIAGLALGVRLAELSVIPANVSSDELDNVQTAYRILEGTGPGFFGLDWKPSPAYSTHLLAGSMKLFGMSIEGLRLPSVLLSTLALLPFYFLARQVISRPASLLATLLLATNLWYLHFSRSGLENVHGAFYATAAALSLALALQRRSWLLYGLTGLFALWASSSIFPAPSSSWAFLHTCRSPSS